MCSCKIGSHSYYLEIDQTHWKSCSFHGSCPLRKTFYGQLERDKIKSVQQNKGNFEANITLSDLSKKELTCWENKIITATKSLKRLPIDTTIYTDASLESLGAVCEKSETGGMWTSTLLNS